MTNLVQKIEITDHHQSEAEAKIAQLAKLPPIEYELARESEAKEMGFRVSVLDKMVQSAKPPDVEGHEDGPFQEIEPWGSPVSGAELLDEIRGAILRFCVLPDYSVELMAAWILHAWVHDASDISPVLAFVSPEKRCGKSTCLSVVSAMVPKAMHTINISSSVLFRVVEAYKPTVLIDEADTFLAENEEMRGILNGGHNRLTAHVWRSVGDDHEPKRFKVWAPKCIAMIGQLPDTLEDRALSVQLRRKEPREAVERFRADRIGDFAPIRQRAARWAADHIITLSGADPFVPDELNDRAQDNARAICAIADQAGAEWPTAIRSALVGSAAQKDDDPQSAGVLLLRDVSEVLENRTGEKIGSSALCEALCALEDSPWAEWRGGNPITTRGIAKLLKAYRIAPTRDRVGRFYRREDFMDAFKRYLSQGGDLSVTSVTSVTSSASDCNKLFKTNGVTLDDACDTCSAPQEDKQHDAPVSVTAAGAF